MKKQIGSPQKEKELPKLEEKLLEEAEARLEIEAKLEPYIQKVEEEPQIPDDLQAHIHVPTQAATQVLQQGPTVQLPLTEDQIKKGLHAQVWDSILWLATFCKKISKEAYLKGIKVIFGKGNNN